MATFLFPVKLGLSLTEAVGGRKAGEGKHCREKAGVNKCRRQQALGSKLFILCLAELPTASVTLEPCTSSGHPPQGSQLPPLGLHGLPQEEL